VRELTNGVVQATLFACLAARISNSSDQCIRVEMREMLSARHALNLTRDSSLNAHQRFGCFFSETFLFFLPQLLRLKNHNKLLQRTCKWKWHLCRTVFEHRRPRVFTMSKVSSREIRTPIVPGIFPWSSERTGTLLPRSPYSRVLEFQTTSECSFWEQSTSRCSRLCLKTLHVWHSYS